MNKKVKVPKTKKQKKIKKHFKLLMIVFILLIIFGSLFFIKKSNKKEEFVTDKKEKNEIKEEIKKLSIYNEDSNMRPYAIMIPNDSEAKKRHYGLQNAYLIYEITVEGGITRLLALYKDVNVEKIGPVRSSRHYYLDYALENDAIYVHFGWSPQAQSDIKTLGINNLNGLYNPSNMFYRDKNYYAPNNAFTTTDNIKKASEDKGYRMTSDNYQLLNYSYDEVDLSTDSTYKVANNIKINYSGGAYVKYVYDATNKYYLRYNNENQDMDLNTNSQMHMKNILVLKMNTTSISGDDKGRQNLNNIGTGNGVYITNGGAIDITWEKTGRKSKTVYKDKSGNVLKINDGNTFIQIQPISRDLLIE